MIAFITAVENTPFSVALLVLVIIALLEGVGMMFGAGISNILEGLFPDADWVVDVDGPDMDSPGVFGRVLSWLQVGKVPIIILLIVFLAGFGISGLILQKILFTSFGFMLPGYLAAIPAFFVTMPIVRVLGSALGKVMPKDETSAVSSDTFVGRVATITIGTAKRNSPAEAKLKDSHGQHHYVMIEPDNDDEQFSQGTDVLLVRQEGAKFYAIANTHQAMTNQ